MEEKMQKLTLATLATASLLVMTSVPASAIPMSGGASGTAMPTAALTTPVHSYGSWYGFGSGYGGYGHGYGGYGQRHGYGRGYGGYGHGYGGYSHGYGGGYGRGY
jgi:hypothetical protein